MNEIITDILTWAWFSAPHGYNFNGYLIRHRDGNLPFPKRHTHPQQRLNQQSGGVRMGNGVR